jgi:hypothetical protein
VGDRLWRKREGGREREGEIERGVSDTERGLCRQRERGRDRE